MANGESVILPLAATASTQPSSILGVPGNLMSALPLGEFHALNIDPGGELRGKVY